MNLVITLLAPLFLAATNGNIGFARLAAAETVGSYRTETNADLIAVALVVAFGMTALASLSQSMDDIPLPLALRLRGNANASNRAAEQNRRALKPNRPSTEPAPPPETPPPPPPAAPEPDQAGLIAKVAQTQKRTAEHLAQFARPKPAATPAPTQEDRHYQALWAAGAAQVAAETAADLANLAPDERDSAAMWVDVLNECAKDLMTGNPAPRLRPGDLAGFMNHAGA
jgi:hypothetical protein